MRKLFSLIEVRGLRCVRVISNNRAIPRCAITACDVVWLRRGETTGQSWERHVRDECPPLHHRYTWWQLYMVALLENGVLRHEITAQVDLHDLCPSALPKMPPVSLRVPPFLRTFMVF